MALIFDIETIGINFDTLDETSQNLLTQWIEREAGDDVSKYNLLLANLKDGLGFSPLTGEIVALGVFDTDRNKGVVYFQSPRSHEEEYQDGSFTFKPKGEEEMLKLFWQGAIRYRTFVSFNGRAFDVPYMLIRGAKYKIEPTINLMAKRYVSTDTRGVKHIDLFDQLSFFGAVRRKGNLHLFCQALGIKSPKGEGITGHDIKKLFDEKRYKEIAEYNSWDLVATWELYDKWQKYVNPF